MAASVPDAADELNLVREESPLTGAKNWKQLLHCEIRIV